MAVLKRAGIFALLGISTLLVAVFAGSVADEVYGDSGITYEEGHPTAYGGVRGCNPLKSLEIAGKIALGYLEELLKIR
ncbi:MAG TPA: hypothetical protein PLZ42_04510 [Methanothrix sp.]|nr:hypothetical protein [Methanothrix sp.]